MSTPHKHAEVIKAWADGAKIEARGQHRGSKWCVVDQPWWTDDQEYRVYDPLREFKEAYAAGKKLQLRGVPHDTNIPGPWLDVRMDRLPSNWWDAGMVPTPDQRFELRVKPEPKTEQFQVGMLYQIDSREQGSGISSRPAPFLMPKVALNITYDPDTGKINDIQVKDWKQ